MNNYRAGIDIGSTTVKLVLLDDENNIIYDINYVEQKRTKRRGEGGT